MQDIKLLEEAKLYLIYKNDMNIDTYSWKVVNE